jgi:hypothetical protein
MLYHVLNRANFRSRLFKKAARWAIRVGKHDAEPWAPENRYLTSFFRPSALRFGVEGRSLRGKCFFRPKAPLPPNKVGLGSAGCRWVSPGGRWRTLSCRGSSGRMIVPRIPLRRLRILRAPLPLAKAPTRRPLGFWTLRARSEAEARAGRGQESMQDAHAAAEPSKQLGGECAAVATHQRPSYGVGGRRRRGPVITLRAAESLKGETLR